ncbi:hypothetical protein HAX54_050915 [Datura stramonium]|uniref:Uncharacterized protein n=1 Tax=Datura stramonium TaxID=4076 RepID=A0ABS8SX38_DATST|nr:hypothetical protein [Datura stramonium]
MARRKRRASQVVKPIVSEKTETPITQEEQKRQVTLADGISKILDPPKSIQWKVGRGSAPTVFHCSQKPGIRGATLITSMPEVSRGFEHVPLPLPVPESPQAMLGIEGEFADPVVATTRKLDYPDEPKLYMADMDGIKVVKPNQEEIEAQCHKWEKALIGYVMGGNPNFKDMLRFVYGVWNMEQYILAVQRVWSQHVQGHDMYGVVSYTGWECREEETNWLSKVVSNRNPERNILGFLYAATVYHTWRERNQRRFKHIQKEPAMMVKEIAIEVHLVGRKQYRWKEEWTL